MSHNRALCNHLDTFDLYLQQDSADLSSTVTAVIDVPISRVPTHTIVGCVGNVPLRHSSFYAEQASRLTPAGNRWAGLTQQARPILILGGSLDGQMRWTRNVPWYSAP